ncbi:MAG TPA: hypothetical protein PLX16_08475, partial [Exilispira sp.]|nr:hypothetical protein [Exilispira sp.]
MKNSLQKILTILIIFLLTVSPILAQESQVIIVNTNSSPSAPIVTATNGIAIKSITSDGALIDDSYWADDLAAQSFLIREKSKKMADSLFKS